jgi:hypothetical protein
MRPFLVLAAILTLSTAALADETPRATTGAAASRATLPTVAPLTPAVTAQHTRLFGALRADLKPKVAMAARILAARVSAPVPPKGKPVDVMAAAHEVVGAAHNFGLGTVNSGDIEALAFIVLMQATKDADEDLRDILAKVKKMNEQKAAIRQALVRCKGDRTCAKRTPPPAGMTRAELEKLVDALADRRDSSGDLDGADALKLQGFLDRRQKLLETLSNLLKKIADTNESIIQNLK